MGGIADRQQARAVPAGQPVKLHRQQMQVADVVELGEVELGRRGGDLLAHDVDPALLILLGGALGDQEGALPIIAAVDHHQQPPALDIPAQAGTHFVGLPDAEPEHVHRRAQILQRKHRADDRCPAVGGDGQPGANLAAVGQADAGYPPLSSMKPVTGPPSRGGSPGRPWLPRAGSRGIPIAASSR